MAVYDMTDAGELMRRLEEINVREAALLRRSLDYLTNDGSNGPHAVQLAKDMEALTIERRAVLDEFKKYRIE